MLGPKNNSVKPKQAGNLVSSLANSGLLPRPLIQLVRTETQGPDGSVTIVVRFVVIFI